MKKNIFYAQSGGVTPVINATAAGLIDYVSRYKASFGKLFVGKNGIAGALNEELIDISKEKSSELKKLVHTPGGAFGSCRIKLKDPVHTGTVGGIYSNDTALYNIRGAHAYSYYKLPLLPSRFLQRPNGH